MIHVANNLRSLPGAVGMYGLSVGVSRIGSTLPSPVYALLSGLNAATVGIIALAAVRLSERAITDKLTRFLVYLGGVLGMLYTALWYYPVIMVGAGVTSLIWDRRYPHNLANTLKSLFKKLRPARRPRSSAKQHIARDVEEGLDIEHPWPLYGVDKPLPPPPPAYSLRDSYVSKSACSSHLTPIPPPPTPAVREKAELPTSKAGQFSSMSWQLGTSIIAVFLATFALTIAFHIISGRPSRSFSIFSSFYLAGTIIFGGGPVVIPLLREYIVTPGWVSPRDFLLGLAIIQAFPGPNFNFAVYLGSLAVAGTNVPSYLGALIAFIAMYAPGLFIVVGFMGLWSLLRNRAWFLSILRGVNAAAVGLVFTAVYKLWQIGRLTATVQGEPLGTDPWLVAITGTAFVGGAWFKISPPLAILLGGAMGVARWALVVH